MCCKIVHEFYYKQNKEPWIFLHCFQFSAIDRPNGCLKNNLAPASAFILIKPVKKPPWTYLKHKKLYIHIYRNGHKIGRSENKSARTLCAAAHKSIMHVEDFLNRQKPMYMVNFHFSRDPPNPIEPTALRGNFEK